MGERPRELDILKLDSNRIRLSRTDPYGKIAVGVLLLKDDHPLVVHQTHSDAVDCHLNHFVTSPASRRYLSGQANDSTAFRQPDKSTSRERLLPL